ncbi:MAG: MGMT family protein [Candidatus Methanofastidiosia archaeon]|jgi:methylated-DNA-protein-cysteine methyltransferase-like protein
MDNDVHTHENTKGFTEQSFTQRIIYIIKNIPPGKVATYGQIADMAGNPRGARQVAWVLHSSSQKYDLPWHRVVNSKGKISLKGEGYTMQKQLLQKEGVIFGENDTIDFEQYLWVL